MDKVLSTVLLTIAAVMAAAMIASSAFPVLTRGTDAMVAASAMMENRIRTSLSVIHVTADQSQNQLYLWVKNTGSIAIDAPDRSDLFVQTPGGGYDRLPYGSGTGKWQYVIQDGGASWTPATTVKITISLAAVAAGQYRVTFVTPSGVGIQSVMSV